ncbi:hypothetical protein [Actinomadura rugatobispora]|uniref:ESX-1 secretion-associated protein n=1 Tax=Actinomadura rugatobispora TaxID=1994 RepID=A0ABW1A2P2_9ACTN|nr:hypothetical protein GCM10010200_017930 [Actinomadura rugatobispora]
MSEVGVNPDEAVAGGREAGMLALSFRGLATMFQSTIDVAFMRAGEWPVKNGYLAYAEEQMSKIARVQAHGEGLSGAVEGAGAAGAETDRRIDEDYQGVRGLLLRDLNHELGRQ